MPLGSWGAGGGSSPPNCAPPAVQEKLKPAFLEQLPKKLQELSRFLGSRPWFAGQKVGGGCCGGFGESLWGLTPPVPLLQLTFVDFLAYDVLDQQRMFVPECPELQGNLAQFLQRFEVSGAGDSPGPPRCPGPVSVPVTRCPHPPPPLCPSPFLTPQFCVLVPSQALPLNPCCFCLHPIPATPVTPALTPVPVPNTPVSPSLTSQCPLPDIPVSLSQFLTPQDPSLSPSWCSHPCPKHPHVPVPIPAIPLSPSQTSQWPHP